MDITVTVTDAAKLAALDKARTAYNLSAQPLSEVEFLQKLVDGQLDGLVASYLVTRITPFDFLNRFTQAERAAIRTAAVGNPLIADYIAMVDAAPAVVLTDALTIAGVNALEVAGLIAPGRGAAILAM
jgi:hypothetical protein